jgi:uncharacterized protein DUF5304
MSDAAEPEAPDADAWATACEEDLAAEKARRRAVYGSQYGSPAEELRRLADAVSERVAELGKPFGATIASAAAQGVAQQLIAQAKAAIEPVVERNPQLFDHLAAAGGELLAAYRAAVQEAEGRWTASAPTTVDRVDSDAPAVPAELPGTAAPAEVERIDLDVEPEGSAGPEGTAKPEDADASDGTDTSQGTAESDRSDGSDRSEAIGNSDVPDAPEAPAVTDVASDEQPGPGAQSGSSGSGSGD